MTSLTQYLLAERPDYSEPASFYVPGAVMWGDPNIKALRGHLKARNNPPIAERVFFEPEEEQQ